MRSVTVNTQTLLLLDEPADWSRPFKVRARVVNSVESGLTNREGRRALGETLRLRLTYQIQATAAEARSIASGLRVADVVPTAAPLWPAACLWADRATAPLTGGLNLLIPAAGGPGEVFESTPPGWAAAGDTLVPLVVGYLAARELTALAGGLAVFPVEIEEDSPPAWAITPAAYTAPAGPRPAAYATAPRLFPFPLAWDQPRTTFSLRLNREELGFGRQLFAVERGAVARSVEQTVWAEADEGFDFAKLLAFFLTHGPGRAFWAPGALAAAVLTADVGANTSAITVDDAAGILPGDYLALVSGASVLAGLGPVLTATGTAVTLTPAGNAAALAATTRLAPLLLARFDAPELTLNFEHGRLALAAFSAREVPPEAVPPVNETLGLYLGTLAARAWLYDFTRDYAGSVVTERYTSYERDLVFNGNTYTAAPISHGDIEEGLALDRNSLDLQADGLSVAPLLALATLRSEVPILLTVRSVEVTGPGTAAAGTVLFTGELAGASMRARRITAKAIPGGTRFDRKTPRAYLQPGCNHALFSPGCGLAASAWVHTATLTNPGTAGYPFAFVIGSLARAGGPALTAADSFAGGWLEAGTGAALQRLPVLASTAAAGGVLTLTLARDPVPWLAAGAALRLYPGCDNTRETCTARFANYVNYGGHPFVPAVNPTLETVKQGSGGKK